jgi:hypothetical protein
LLICGPHPRALQNHPRITDRHRISSRSPPHPQPMPPPRAHLLGLRPGGRPARARGHAARARAGSGSTRGGSSRRVCVRLHKCLAVTRGDVAHLRARRSLLEHGHVMEEAEEEQVVRHLCATGRSVSQGGGRPIEAQWVGSPSGRGGRIKLSPGREESMRVYSYLFGKARKLMPSA